MMSELYSRDAWKQRSRLTPITWSELFQKIEISRDKTAGTGSRIPTVVFDLDSTLYDVSRRTLAIAKEWMDWSELSEHASLKKIAGELELADVRYSLRETFEEKAARLSLVISSEHVVHLRNFWFNRFFTSQYLMHDDIYPGALEAVKQVYNSGINIVYLTAREERTMGQGTRERLLSDGFPLNTTRTQVILRDDASSSDLDHKANALSAIKDRVICSIENEPANLVAMYHARPDCIHVLKETVCSQKPAKPVSGLYSLKSFKL